MSKTTIIKRDGTPGGFDECRRLLAACSLGSGGAYMADMVRKADDELDRLEADARAIWAVRVLDRGARAHNRRPTAPLPCLRDVDGLFRHTGEFLIEGAAGRFGSEDAARIAAAEALVAEDPSLGEGL